VTMEEIKSQQGVNKCLMKLFVANCTAGAKTRRAGLWNIGGYMVDLDGILAFGGDISSYDEYVVGLRCVQFGSFIDTLLLMGQSGSRKAPSLDICLTLWLEPTSAPIPPK
jgi:hypothetical protein